MAEIAPVESRAISATAVQDIDTITLTDSDNPSPSSVNISNPEDEIFHDANDEPESSLKNIKVVTDPPGLDTTTNESKKPENQFPFKFGPYVPILKQTDGRIIIDTNGVVDYYHDSNPDPASKRLIGEILPGDSIVDAPSMVTPLLLKKQTIWPPLEKKEDGQSSDSIDDVQLTDKNDLADSSDDIQVVKVIKADKTLANLNKKKSRCRPTGEYIKATIVSNLTNNLKQDPIKSILAIPDYYKTTSADLLLSIGLNQVSEYNLEDEIRKMTSKIRRGSADLIPKLEKSREELENIKKYSRPYKLDSEFKCSYCPFSTEFAAILRGHLETPHRNNKRDYLCNWCDFKTKDSGQIIYHNYVVHRKRSRIEQALAPHCCQYCSFESRSKRTFTNHALRCEQHFKPELVQAFSEIEKSDCPAVTSKFITQDDVSTYESTLKALRLAAYNPHQIKVSGSLNQGLVGQPILVVPRASIATSSYSSMAKVNNPQTSTSASVVTSASPYTNSVALFARGNIQIATTKTADAQSNQTSGHLLHLLATQGTSNNIQQNRATILKHPKAQSSFANGMSVMKNAQNVIMAPQSSSNNPASAPNKTSANTVKNQQDKDSADDSSSGSPSPKGTFVICEICDGYIENLSQFKSHMQWIHKVRIHQKTLASPRPPLNCQKCQWRFFTDQGLERHLLGAHGLVTSNMQELADNDSDSGRCTICGCKFAKKLIAHMKDFHKSNLKPAHLSYKCTVCSATFGLYRLFENHVYKVHGDSIKSTPS